MARLKALMRMTAVRLSAIYLLVFSVAAVVLVFYVTATASGILEAQSRTAIAEEINELSQIYQTSGIVGLVRTIDRRARQPGASLYLVTDATGRIIAGNVESLQAGVLDDSGFTPDAFAYERFASDRGDRYHLAIAEVVSLPNGMRILVGRDQADQVRFRDVVRSALILALGLMGAAALFAWFFVGRRALQRLDRMSASSARILAGDLTERLPVTGAGDEFDRLSDNLNTLLARVALLQEGLRQVSDNIAHDLKTPLTRLRTRAESALATNEPERRGALEATIAEADQMIRTFDALLMISRVEAGSHPVLKEEADISAIAADVAELYEPSAEDVGGTIELEAPEPVARPRQPGTDRPGARQPRRQRAEICQCRRSRGEGGDRRQGDRRRALPHRRLGQWGRHSGRKARPGAGALLPARPEPFPPGLRPRPVARPGDRPGPRRSPRA